MSVKMEERCIHYWMIGIANGPTSDGVCQKCGILKSFYNSIGVDIKQISLKNRDDKRTDNSKSGWMEHF